jgi:hypothetical protein
VTFGAERHEVRVGVLASIGDALTMMDLERIVPCPRGAALLAAVAVTLLDPRP